VCAIRSATCSTTCPNETGRPSRSRLRRAWKLDDHTAAREQLQTLAGELARSHPGAAASLHEGLEETLTITRLGVRGALKRTLQSTNPIESMIEIVRRTSRNVKRWQHGEMCLRWTAAGMLEAERQFRRIIGYSELAKLALAVEHDLATHHVVVDTPTSEEAATLTTALNVHTGTAVTNFHNERDILSQFSITVTAMPRPGARASARSQVRRGHPRLRARAM
jgi:hypothetical protein